MAVYKSGALVLAKSGVYPHWPARVEGIDGEKLVVKFFGSQDVESVHHSMLLLYNSESKEK